MSVQLSSPPCPVLHCLCAHPIPIPMSSSLFAAVGCYGGRTTSSLFVIIVSREKDNIKDKKGLPGAGDASQTHLEPRAQTTKHSFVVWAHFVSSSSFNCGGSDTQPNFLTSRCVYVCALGCVIVVPRYNRDN